MKDENARDDAEEYEERLQSPHSEESGAGLLPQCDPVVAGDGLNCVPTAPSPMARWDDPVPAISPDVARTAPFTHARLRAIPRGGDTEDLLNGLIAECHFLMREVALPTAIRVEDANTRAQFLRSAMSLAKTGATVGKTIAKLRGAGAVTEIRQRHFTEHVMTTPAPSTENELRT